MGDSEDVWRRVEANKRIAQSYLTDHEPHYPKFWELPTADWHLSREPVELLPEGATRCAARAREEGLGSMSYGGLGFYDFVEVQCALDPAHAGDHVSSCVRYPLKRKWTIVSWRQEA